MINITYSLHARITNRLSGDQPSRWLSMVRTFLHRFALSTQKGASTFPGKDRKWPDNMKNSIKLDMA
jgi:hypothetical protein